MTIAIIVHLLKFKVIWLELPPRGHRDAFSASMTPRTLNQLVAFTLNRQPYALRLASVRQVLRTVEVTPLPKAPEIVLGVVSLGGAVIPVLSIRRRLGLREREASLSDQLIVADSGCRTIALLVDAVIGVVERSTEEITDAERIVPGALMIGDLLNLARLDRREAVSKMTPLNSLVEDVLQDLKSEIDGRKIDWHIGSLPAVNCDPGLLQQAFANLLSNAVKYTRRRERAVIEVDQMTIDGEAVIYVRDNGAGFDSKYAGKLFGAFQRLHTAEEFEGTGVGLASVQRIIRKHGG